MEGKKLAPRFIQNVRELLKKHDVVINDKYVSSHHTNIRLPVIDIMIS